MGEINSLVIYLPLLKANNSKFDLKETFFEMQHHLDKTSIFNAFKKYNFIDYYAIKAHKKEYNFFFGNTRIPDKLFIIVDLYYLESKYNQDSSRFYFLRIEIISRVIIEYTNLIQRIYDNKNLILTFIALIISEYEIPEENKEKLIKIVEDHKDQISLLFSNLFFHNLAENFDKIIQTFKTGKKIYEDLNIVITTNLFLMIWINRIKTRHSSQNLRIIMIRAFLMKFFSWINSRNFNIRLEYNELLRDYLFYYKYQVYSSRNRQIYNNLAIFLNPEFDSNFDLVIFDTLNQNYFLNKSTYTLRLDQVEDFLSKSVANLQISFKFAFTTDDILRGTPHAFNYLEKNGWNFIYVLKDKIPDYDTKICTFIEELSILFSYKWNNIYIISSDRDIVNYMKRKFISNRRNMLYFITHPDDTNLNSYHFLSKMEIEKYDFNIYFH